MTEASFVPGPRPSLHRRHLPTLAGAGNPNTFLGSLEFTLHARLFHLGRVRWYDHGDTIYHQGQIANSVMAVVQGRVSLESGLPTGNPFVGICHAGHLLGDSETLSDRDNIRRHTARALDDVQILTVPLADFVRLVAEEPAMWAPIARDTRARLDTAEFWIGQLAGATSDQRLARILLYFADQEELRASRPAVLNLNSRTLASWIGVNSRTIQRHMTAWEKLDFITRRKSDGKVWILNGNALAGIAKFEKAPSVPPASRAVAKRTA